MKLLVVGATGRTGRRVVDEACSRGHTVTAIVRARGGLPDHRLLREVAGDPLSPDFLRPLVLEADVVISALGIKSGGDAHLLERAAGAMLELLGDRESPRYIVLSQSLLFPSRNPVVRLLRKILAVRVADSIAMEKSLSSSSANWTIVRPPRLTDRTEVRGYRWRRDARPPGFSMRRIDLARYLVDEAEGRMNERAIVGVA